MIIYRLLELIRTADVKKESQETKEQTIPQTTQPKESKLSIKRRDSS